MTALACVTLLVSGAGSPQLAGDRCARSRNRRCGPCENYCNCSSETVQYTEVRPSSMDQAVPLSPATTLHSVKSP